MAVHAPTTARGTDTFLYNNGPVTSLDDENLLFRQTFTLDVSTDGGASYGDPIADGPGRAVLHRPRPAWAVAQDYVKNLRTPGDHRCRRRRHGPWPTQTEDPFFLDLRVFDLLYGGDLSETRAGHARRATTSTASCSRCPRARSRSTSDATSNPVIGVWSTTTRPTLRNADGSAADDGLHAGVPARPAAGQRGRRARRASRTPSTRSARTRTPPPPTAPWSTGCSSPEVPAAHRGHLRHPGAGRPRYDIFEVFLTGVVSNAVVDVDGDPATREPDRRRPQLAGAERRAATFQPSEMLRLNMSITGPTGLDGKPLEEASRLGVIGGDIQGFPNGRRLADDVVDIEILALEGIYDVSNVPADRQAAFDALKRRRRRPGERQRRSARRSRTSAGPTRDAVNETAVRRRPARRSAVPGNGGTPGRFDTLHPGTHGLGRAPAPRGRARSR